MQVPDVLLVALGASRRLWPVHVFLAACGAAMGVYGLVTQSWLVAALGACFGTMFGIAVAADLSMPREPASRALRIGLPAVLAALVVVGVLLAALG